MPSRDPFEYVVFRVVPDLDRGEFVNVGVMVICRPRTFLAARTGVDRDRLAILAPCLTSEDVDDIESRLDLVTQTAAGLRAAGPIARLGQGERWHWLASPVSTTIQPSPIHTGLTDDPEKELRQLFEELVEVPRMGQS